MPSEVELSSDKWGLEGLSENVGAPSAAQSEPCYAATLADLARARLLLFGDQIVRGKDFTRNCVVR